MKTFFSSKDVFIFLFFLLLSFAFWYMINLRHVYEITLSVPITYKNIPIEKINESDLPCQVPITLKDQGFYLLSYHIRKINPIIIDLHNDAADNGKTLHIPNTLLQMRIKEELRHSTDIFGTPEIIAPIVKKTHKILPIRFAGKINFAQQYNLSGDIVISPSKIDVFGEKAILDTIQAVYTEAILFKNLKDTVNQNIALRKSALEYAAENVKIHIPVDKFTEKTLEIPVAGKNLPVNMNIRFFPSTVKAQFFVTFSKFNLVNANSFEAEIDYKNIVKNKNGRQKPNIKTSNPYVFNLRTSPAEVEYLIEMIQ